MAELTTKHVVRLSETQKEFLDSQVNGSEFIRLKINEESISEQVLNVASDVYEEIKVCADNCDYLSFEYTVNELGEFSFDCQFYLKLKLIMEEEENDLGYYIEVIDKSIMIDKVYKDGEEIDILKTALKKIKKDFENNLTFDIYR